MQFAGNGEISLKMRRGGLGAVLRGDKIADFLADYRKIAFKRGVFRRGLSRRHRERQARFIGGERRFHIAGSDQRIPLFFKQDRRPPAPRLNRVPFRHRAAKSGERRRLIAARQRHVAQLFLADRQIDPPGGRRIRAANAGVD